MNSIYTRIWKWIKLTNKGWLQEVTWKGRRDLTKMYNFLNRVHSWRIEGFLESSRRKNKTLHCELTYQRRSRLLGFIDSQSDSKGESMVSDACSPPPVFDSHRSQRFEVVSNILDLIPKYPSFFTICDWGVLEMWVTSIPSFSNLTFNSEEKFTTGGTTSFCKSEDKVTMTGYLLSYRKIRCY
jgi:hypothetical protein